jgi:hypothetical protein
MKPMMRKRSRTAGRDLVAELKEGMLALGEHRQGKRTLRTRAHKGGTIVLTPLRPAIAAGEARRRAKTLIQRNKRLFKRLA